MVVYSVKERVQIIKWYYACGSAQEVIGRFIFNFPDRPVPARETIYRIIHKFNSTGCVTTCKKCNAAGRKKPVISEEREQREVNVCALAEASEPGEPCSSQKIARETGISSRTVQNILKRNQYKCYKVQEPQEPHELLSGDHLKRMEFCEEMKKKADLNEDFIKNILFTDQTSFSLEAHPNPAVAVYWSRESKDLSVPTPTQCSLKLNIWCGILGDYIIGPFFFDEALDAEKYLILLQNHILPSVRSLNVDVNEIWFQQNECVTYNTRKVLDYLELTFPDRLISSGGTMNWPPRSPDLSPHYYFLWGYVKKALYGDKYDRALNLADLRRKIDFILSNIPPETLSSVRQEFYDRLGYCSEQKGDIVEPLVKKIKTETDLGSI